jgi:hypothetical protein
MTERLGVSSLWADTLATFRAHRTVLLTLAAAFIFLPQIVASLALQAAGVTLDLGAMLRGGSGNMPDLPAWFGPLNLLLFAVQLLVIIPVTRLALGLVGPDETVADMLRNAAGRMPGVLKAFLFLVLLYIGVVIAIVIPLALIGALTGSGRATGAAAAPSPGTSAIAALIAAALLALAFYVMARMSPWMSVLIAENPGARATVRRAWALTRGRAGRILLIFLVLLIAALIASVVVGGLAHALGAAGAVVGEGFGPFLAAVVNGAFGALLSLLYYILLAHLYRHLATGERPAV